MPSARASYVLALVIIGVLVWGAFHALGAYRFNHNPWRAAMVMGCVLTFLGVWGLLLWNRARRTRRQI